METDRSRIIAYQRCPRERFLAYHVGGTGLQRTRKSLPLQFGSAFHEGAGVLLAPQEADDPPLTSSQLITAAVCQALFFLKKQFENHAVGFDGELPADAEAAMAYGQEEQMALAEALLRAWWAYEGETFLETFEVIEVEQEGRALLSADIGRASGGADEGLVLMFRPDALVRDRMSGDLYVVSWKTCATFGKRNVDQARHDAQSISEVWGLLNSDTWNMNWDGQRIEGVLYKWIVKGRRSLDSWDGLYKQNTHLIYGWRRLNMVDSEAEWSWAYDWKDDTVNPKTGKPVGHNLGKGWKKVPIWRDYPGGVTAWIEDLAANRIFPRHMDALAQVFPQALPVERRADEVESWKRQVVAQELKVAESVEFMKNSEDLTPEEYAANLDEHFPQFTHSCHSWSGCAFLGICWEGVEAKPGDLYQIRLANHPEKGDDE